MPSSKFVVGRRPITILLLAVTAPVASWGFSQDEVLQFQKAVGEMNKTLPTMTSREMQLTRVEFRGGSEFVYVSKSTIYSFNQINPRQLETNLKPTAVNGIFTTPDTRNMVKKGMKYTYVFYDKDNKYLSEYSIAAKDCGF